MSVNMHLRDVPDGTHAELARRAEAEGMTLRQYTLDVLANHCALPTTNAWLDGLARRRVRRLVDSVEAVQESRDADDETIANAGPRRG